MSRSTTVTLLTTQEAADVLTITVSTLNAWPEFHTCPGIRGPLAVEALVNSLLMVAIGALTRGLNRQQRRPSSPRKER